MMTAGTRMSSLPPHTVTRTPRGLHVAHVVASIDDKAGGTSVMVQRLCQSLAALGHRIEIMTADAGEAGSRSTRERGLEIKAFPPSRGALAKPLVCSPGLKDAVDEAASAGVILHTHGLWRMPNIYACRSARRHAGGVVVSTHGMLAPSALKFSPLQKAVFARTVQNAVFKSVTCFHATSEEELGDIRAYGIEAPVAVIPNGVDIPEPRLATLQPPSARSVLFLGRLHPIKALDCLLHAWARVEADQPDWRLRLVGPSEGGHEAELRRLGQSLGLARLSIEPAVFSGGKLDALREAGLFVLPSHSENFGVVVAEALAAGTPVIASTGTPWRGLVSQGCGWWVDNGVESLAAALQTAMRLPDAVRLEMGAKGRAWMARDYSWQRIAIDMADVYRWCRTGSMPPGCVDIVGSRR